MIDEIELSFKELRIIQSALYFEVDRMHNSELKDGKKSYETIEAQELLEKIVESVSVFEQKKILLFTLKR